MIDDLALWFACNPNLDENLVLCIINRMLIVPGIFSMFFIFLMYAVGSLTLMVWGSYKVFDFFRNRFLKKRNVDGY